MSLFKNVEKERSKYYGYHPYRYVQGVPLAEQIRLKEMLNYEEYNRMRERQSIIRIFVEEDDWCHWESLQHAIEQYYAYPDWQERYY